jgi:hypothetical protein
MAEAFIKSFKRDYVYLSRLETAESVLNQLADWFEDYNERGRIGLSGWITPGIQESKFKLLTCPIWWQLHPAVQYRAIKAQAERV